MISWCYFLNILNILCEWNRTKYISISSHIYLLYVDVDMNLCRDPFYHNTVMSSFILLLLFIYNHH